MNKIRCRLRRCAWCINWFCTYDKTGLDRFCTPDCSNRAWMEMNPTKQQADAAWVSTFEALMKLREETDKKKFALVLEQGVMIWEEVKKVE